MGKCAILSTLASSRQKADMRKNVSGVVDSDIM
jgi:hypothetical protein